MPLKHRRRNNPQSETSNAKKRRVKQLSNKGLDIRDLLRKSQNIRKPHIQEEEEDEQEKAKTPDVTDIISEKLRSTKIILDTHLTTEIEKEAVDIFVDALEEPSSPPPLSQREKLRQRPSTRTLRTSRTSRTSIAFNESPLKSELDVRSTTEEVDFSPIKPQRDKRSATPSPSPKKRTSGRSITNTPPPPRFHIPSPPPIQNERSNTHTGTEEDDDDEEHEPIRRKSTMEKYLKSQHRLRQIQTYNDAMIKEDREERIRARAISRANSYVDEDVELVKDDELLLIDGKRRRRRTTTTTLEDENIHDLENDGNFLGSSPTKKVRFNV